MVFREAAAIPEDQLLEALKEVIAA